MRSESKPGPYTFKSRMVISWPLVFILLSPAVRPSFAQSQAASQEDELSSKQLGFTQNVLGPICVIPDKPNHPVEVKDSHGRYQTIVGFCPSFTATDGQIVTTQIFHLVSPTYVPIYVEHELRDAQILSREPRRDTNGKVIGERIVALRSIPTEPDKRDPNDPHRVEAMILWIDGTFSAEICCPSLDDALAFEKAYQSRLLHHT